MRRRGQERLSAWTRHAETLGLVERLCEQIVPGARVLPRSRVLGPLGYPIIWLDEGVHLERSAEGAGPISSFDTLARTLAHAPGELPLSAVSLLAFVSTEPAERAVKDLLGVRVYCRAAVLVPHGGVLGEPLLSEFDYLGITVASVSSDGEVNNHVLGDAGRRPGTDVAHAWARLREEQLYATALAGSASRRG